MVNKHLRKETADAGTVLQKKVEEFVTGRSDPLAADITLYNPDYINLRDTPPEKIRAVNLQPSPSPEPAVPFTPSPPDSSPDPPNRAATSETRMELLCELTDFFVSVVSQLGVTGSMGKLNTRPLDLRKRMKKRSDNVKASDGDRVLVQFMGDGKESDVSHEAAMRPLASDDEKDSAVKQALMKAMKAWIKNGTEERGQNWKESRKRWRRMGSRKELRKELREELKQELKKKLRKELRKELRKRLL
jgi:hypothetical protein